MNTNKADLTAPVPSGASKTALFNRDSRLLNLLRAARPFVEEAGEISGYGFYRPENPHNFTPDPESCSDQEMENHKAACEAWDRGDYKAPEQSGFVHNDQGEFVAHVLRAPWGIGSYTGMRDDAANLLAAIDCVIGPQA